MKPMRINEYTVPVGNECVIPSYVEALRFFQAEGLNGKVEFGIAETQKGDVLCWGCLIGENYHVVSAFENKDETQLISFTVLSSGSRFVFNNRTYVLLRNKELKLVIREMTALPHEGEVCGGLDAVGKKYQSISVVKLYKIGAKNEYLAPFWYVDSPEDEDEPYSCMPIFFCDLQILDSVPENSLNWEFVYPGEVFLHGDELWQLYEDEDKHLYVNKAVSRMRIVKSDL